MTAWSEQLAQLQDLQSQQQALELDYLALQAERQQQQQAASPVAHAAATSCRLRLPSRKRPRPCSGFFTASPSVPLPIYRFTSFCKLYMACWANCSYTRNCYVCFTTPKPSNDFPYYVDERDGDRLQLSHVPYRRGLTRICAAHRQTTADRRSAPGPAAGNG